MNEIVKIGNSDISIKEYNGQRVVTFSDIDNVHQRPDGTAGRNFRNNRGKFILGEDYFVVCSDEIRRTKMFEIPSKATSDYILVTEQGYLMLVKSLNDDLSWEVQRKLVSSYFRVRSIASDELSPQMQILMNMVNKMAMDELEKKQIKEQLEKHEKAVETIKDAVKPITENWREETNKKINRIQANVGTAFAKIRAEMYAELESRAGCDLKTRLNHRKDRMRDDGYTKTRVNSINTMDIIEDDKKLKEIFSKIVSEYEIKYCA